MVAASYSKMVLPTFIVWPRAWSLWTKWMLNRMNVLTHADVVLLTMCQLVKQAKYELSFHCTFNHAYDTNWCPNDCAAMFVSSTVMNCKKRFAIRTCTAQSECKQVMEQTIAFQWDVKQMTHTSGNTRLLCVAFKSTVFFFFSSKCAPTGLNCSSTCTCELRHESWQNKPRNADWLLARLLYFVHDNTSKLHQNHNLIRNCTCAFTSILHFAEV